MSISFDDRRPPITPQLALRVAILGGVALILFAIVFFRLWYLQVLSGDQFRQEALDNRVRTMVVPAPRGDVVDRNGRVLVENRVATVVELDPKQLPASERKAALDWEQLVIHRARLPKGHKGPVPKIPPPTTPELEQRFKRLGAVLRMSPHRIQERVIQQLGVLPYANVRVRTDVPETMRDYLLENERHYRGVGIRRVYLRRYPEGTLAAQLVGTTGQISAGELGTKEFRGVGQGTVVGQQGIERTWDSVLRGTDGKQSITVDAAGRPKKERTVSVPRTGSSLRTSLDLPLQRTGERAMASMIAGGTGDAGGFVALDPRNGQVLAMGSYPTFDPKVLASPISQTRYDAQFNTDAAPLVNRAMSGAYPTGSIFKPITALAALERGVITPDTPIDDPGFLQLDKNRKIWNAGHVANGTLSLRRALQVSSDVFFYKLGRDLNFLRGQALQTWARKLGLGHDTGIDLPDERGGTMPDKAWRARLKEQELACEKRRKVASCGLTDKRPWSEGDNINLAVGQGDLQATPLQMAVAYATLANDGKVVRPHLGLAVEDEAGSEIQRLGAPPKGKVAMNDADRQAILDGLHMATIEDGTSAAVFSDWNQGKFKLYGKTGTAERGAGNLDQSWYVGFVNDAERPIVIATTIEKGGWGASAAAPVTCRMLAAWYHEKATCAPGDSHTN